MSEANQTEYLPESPFPGINPFSYAYKDVFFARESEAHNLIRLIVMYRGVLLYSDSGAGKSSLINAGIIPLAITEGFQPERIRVQPKRGEEIVVERLSEKVAGEPPFLPSIFASDEQQEHVVLSIEEFEKTLRQPDLAVTPLLIFDQFEEWVTLFEEGSKRETAGEAKTAQDSIRDMIASLINDSELPVKILIVLREDYLAKLEPLFKQCPRLPDQYLRLTSLSGDQVYQAIRGPFEKKCPVKYQPEISVSLAKEIRSQFEERSKGTDIRLTEVQIVCRSLFESGKQGPDLEQCFTKTKKGVQGILEEYLEGALESLETNQQGPAVGLLTRMVTSAGTRNVISEDNLLKLVEKEDRVPRELLIKTLDSLERKTKLVWREPRREVYYYEIASEFLVGWIRRKAQERRYLAEQRKLKRHRRISALLAAALLILGAGIYLYYYCLERTHVSYYNTYTKRWGIPKGVGRLTKRQVQSRAVSLKFTRKGRKGPVLRMEAVDRRRQLTPKHNVGTYLKRKVDQISLSRECRWEYVRDSKGQIVYEMAYDKDKNLVWGLVYSPAVKGEANKRDAHYVGPDGYPRLLTKSAANFVSFEYSPRGEEVYMRYFDRKHKPIPGPDKAFGRLQKFDKRGLVLEIISLGIDDVTINDEFGNANFKTIKYDELGNIEEAVALDDSNELTTTIEGWAKYRAVYDSNGNCVEWVWFGVDDEPTLHKDGYHKGTYRYDGHGNIVEECYYDVDGKPTLRAGGYARVIAQHDHRGNPIEVCYFGVDGEPAIHADGNHSWECHYDDDGNRIQLLFLDADKKLTLIKSGYAGLKSGYNDLGNEIRRTYLGVDGKSVSIKAGYAGWKKKYNDQGNQIHCAYFGADGEPAIHTDGNHAYKSLYDDLGNEIHRTYLGVDCKPVSINNGYAGWKKEFDDRGNQVHCAYFGADGEAVLSKNGYAGWESEYDDRGNLIRLAYFGVDGQPVIGKNGYAGYMNKFDRYGNEVEYTFFGIDGEPVISKDGYAGRKSEYDKNRNEVKVTYLGVDGKPMIAKNGYAGWTSEYDNRDNEVSRAYFGVSGETVTGSDGYAGWYSRYDAYGNESERAYFGTDGKPVTARGGYAGWRSKYDSHGNKTETAYFDVNENPTLIRNGYVRWTNKYDAHNRLIEQGYFGIYGERVKIKDGYARLINQYDLRGNKIETAYFGVYDEPAILTSGYHRVKRCFDNCGNVIELTYFHVNGKPAMCENSYARLFNKYDECGNLIEQAVFGIERKPTTLNGFHVSRRCLDRRGNNIEESFFDVNDEPVLHRDDYHMTRSRFDDHGNVIQRSYLDKSGRLVKTQMGYARETYTFDHRGNQIETAFYGIDGEPASNKNEQGIARCTSEYDDRGDLIKRFFFGVDGEPYLLEGGYSGWGSVYDDHGNTIGTTYYGDDEKPLLLKQGYAGWKAKYDQHGNEIETSYYGADGKPVMRNDGYFRLAQKFNERRQLLEMTTYNVGGNLVLNSSGFARVVREYDERGNLTEIAAFDADGELSNALYGYARMTYKYDQRGNKVEEAYFGENGEPITLDDTYTRWVSKFDEYGNVIEETYYGPDGELVNRLDGYARVVRRFNEQRQMIEEKVFGSENEAATVYDGPHIIRYKYDDRGNTIEESYFGINEEPVLFRDEIFSPCARWVGEYDAAGKLVVKRYYDEKNKLITPAASTGSVRSVTIGTGDVGGIYYPSGRVISRMINEQSNEYDTEATFKSTEGSVYNINAVLNGEFDFGIAQSDRQYQAYNGKAEWSKSGSQEDLRAVFSIHPESITLIASAESGITSVADLRGKRVNIGSPGSGQLQNSKDVLSAFGIDLNGIKAEQKDVFEALGLLQSGKIDAFFYTVGHPSDNIEQATSGKVKVNIIPIKGEGIDALLEKYPYYAEAVIPGKLYPNALNKSDVNSIGVKATLVTTKNQDEEVVYAITKEVFDNLEDFKKMHPAYSALTQRNMLEGLSAPIHNGALKYYKEKGLVK